MTGTPNQARGGPLLICALAVSVLLAGCGGTDGAAPMANAANSANSATGPLEAAPAAPLATPVDPLVDGADSGVETGAESSQSVDSSGANPPSTTAATDPPSVEEIHAPPAIEPLPQTTASLSAQLDHSYQYADQPLPLYIQKDNTALNPITDAGASLGRVLFYDARLSTSNSISCGSCHQQSLAFSDSQVLSNGVNGVTGRHSMRLINTRFADERRFFWDERADTLEEQVTQPVRDHGEMGFSGTDGAPDFNSLLTRLAATDIYPELFTRAYGNPVISEAGMQNALAQFIRSIQSFDSRYDQGRALAASDNEPFANFSERENEGKRLFMQRAEFEPSGGRRVAGSGLGCHQCHRAPTFDIVENSRNNGVISVAGSLFETDTGNTRSPSLRDLFNAQGEENGPFMHDGSLATVDDVLDHYNDISVDRQLNPQLDNRLNGLNPNGGGGPAVGQKLLMSAEERLAIGAFLQTLSGQRVYTDGRWSNPFGADGSLDLSRGTAPQ